MKSLDRARAKPTTVIMLTPFLDVMTTLLIFLIVTFAPDEAKIEVSSAIQLPKAEHFLKGVPSVRIEVTESSLRINGKVIEGTSPTDPTSTTWNLLKTAIDEVRQKEDQRVLVVADKATPFRLVDLTVAHLSAAGFSDIYLLTEMKESAIALNGGPQ